MKLQAPRANLKVIKLAPGSLFHFDLLGCSHTLTMLRTLYMCSEGINEHFVALTKKSDDGMCHPRAGMWRMGTLSTHVPILHIPAHRGTSADGHLRPASSPRTAGTSALRVNLHLCLMHSSLQPLGPQGHCSCLLHSRGLLALLASA